MHLITKSGAVLLNHHLKHSQARMIPMLTDILMVPAIWYQSSVVINKTHVGQHHMLISMASVHIGVQIMVTYWDMGTSQMQTLPLLPMNIPMLLFFHLVHILHQHSTPPILLKPTILTT